MEIHWSGCLKDSLLFFKPIFPSCGYRDPSNSLIACVLSVISLIVVCLFDTRLVHRIYTPNRPTRTWLKRLWKIRKRERDGGGRHHPRKKKKKILSWEKSLTPLTEETGQEATFWLESSKCVRDGCLLYLKSRRHWLWAACTCWVLREAVTWQGSSGKTRKRGSVARLPQVLEISFFTGGGLLLLMHVSWTLWKLHLPPIAHLDPQLCPLASNAHPDTRGKILPTSGTVVGGIFFL